MAERHYDDDEVREILARATEVRDAGSVLPALPAAHPSKDGSAYGLTLAEVQEVAAEAGIPPARIAEAASAVDIGRAGVPAPTTALGIPVSTAHAVQLPRMLDADEWDRFVVRLRDTFDAPGTVVTEGSLQTWSNGNLKVMLEPLEKGARLRFQSLHAVSKGHLDGAIVSVVTGVMLLALFLALALSSDKSVPWGLFALAGSMPTAGVGLWALGRSTAAKWLPERRQQFLALGAEALEVVGDDGE